MLNSLKFRISATLIVLLALSGGAAGYVFLALDQQRSNNEVVALAGRLQLTAQFLSNQAMRYKEHAPRDYTTYHRDLELYYQDLLGHVETFDMIADAFMHQDFQPMVTGLVDTLRPRLGSKVMAAATDLETAWYAYRAGLFEQLGPDPAAPRLEWGAEFVLDHNAALEAATERLVNSLKSWARNDLQRVRNLILGATGLGLSVSVAVLLWLYRRVLRPLDDTVSGFRRLTQGDFGTELAVFGSAEAVDLAQSFNRLSARLKVLFDLLERLQEGSDLRQVLAFLSSEFQHLLRTDWIGVLFVTGDAQTIKLEAAYLDGEPEIAGKHLFPLRETLLAQALDAAKPLHIADLDRTASDHPTYVFLRQLRDKGMRDAILLPLDEHAHSPIRGILVFASRNAESYDREHLQLLNNIGELVTHSFGRTVKLAEHARLAAIGEFASGIVHELRSPLATIGMALDHFGGLELSASSAKRAELAAAEAARTARLLDDILLYARPMQLNMLPLDLADFSVQMSETYRGLAEQHGKRLEIRPGAAAPVIADRDRLAQVWLNLTRNALEAAPAGSAITWQLLDNRERDAVEMQIDNPGAVIPPEQLERLTEPFFTTKSGGTGLGLAIVKRIVDAHGGELEIRSQVAGTRVTVSLPRSGN